MLCGREKMLQELLKENEKLRMHIDEVLWAMLHEMLTAFPPAAFATVPIGPAELRCPAEVTE